MIRDQDIDAPRDNKKNKEAQGVTDARWRKQKEPKMLKRPYLGSMSLWHSYLCRDYWTRAWVLPMVFSKVSQLHPPEYLFSLITRIPVGKFIKYMRWLSLRNCALWPWRIPITLVFIRSSIYLWFYVLLI